MAQAQGGEGGEASSQLASKKSSIAQAAGAEIIAPPARIKIKPKDPL